MMEWLTLKWSATLSFIFYWFGMVRRKLTIPERWQAVVMHNGVLTIEGWQTTSRFMGRRARIP
jgi:hypothetical protein